MKRIVMPMAAIALLVMVFVAGPVQSVSAHAEPERANPPINGTVDTAPTQVEIWFTEEVSTEQATIAVFGPDGSQVDLGDTTVDLNDPEHKHVTVSLQPNLAGGVYTVEWSTLSAEDQDEASGSFNFTIAGAGTPEASPSPGASPVASPSPAGSPVSSASETPVTSGQVTEPSEFDSQAFAIAVGAGLVAALLIYLFWRMVRPKQPVSG